MTCCRRKQPLMVAYVLEGPGLGANLKPSGTKSATVRRHSVYSVVDGPSYVLKETRAPITCLHKKLRVFLYMLQLTSLTSVFFFLFFFSPSNQAKKPSSGLINHRIY